MSRYRFGYRAILCRTPPLWISCVTTGIRQESVWTNLSLIFWVSISLTALIGVRLGYSLQGTMRALAAGWVIFFIHASISSINAFQAQLRSCACTPIMIEFCVIIEPSYWTLMFISLGGLFSLYMRSSCMKTWIIIPDLLSPSFGLTPLYKAYLRHYSVYGAVCTLEPTVDESHEDYNIRAEFVVSPLHL